MGLTKVTTKLTNLADTKKSFESLFLVDAGATDSMAPSDELQKLGIKEEGRMAYELADGTIKEYSFGLVRIEFMGETTAGRVNLRGPRNRAAPRSNRSRVGRDYGRSGQQDSQASAGHPTEITKG